jgi:2',3'-cyclic-nucleotide 2'-phosphodiesterase/3'-nucleotidase
VYLTGPAAASYQPAGVKVEKLGDGPDGFVKVRVIG